MFSSYSVLGNMLGIIIHHLDGLFGSNIMTSSQLAC